MKKLYLVILVALLFATSVFAKIHPITDWDDNFQERIISPENRNSCEEKCPGYDITTTTCYNDEEILEGCPEEGCGYYYRCVVQ